MGKFLLSTLVILAAGFLFAGCVSEQQGIDVGGTNTVDGIVDKRDALAFANNNPDAGSVRCFMHRR